MKALLLHSSFRPLFHRLSRPILRNRRLASTYTLPDELYDVVIVGGGPAGLCLASSLRSSYVTSGLKIALVEGFSLASSRNWSPKPTEYANRVVSLTPTSISFLDRIGAWNHVRRERVQAYEGMQVWDGVSDARIEFGDVKRKDNETIAYMTENVNLVHGLLKRIDELGGVEIIDATKVQGITHGVETDEVDLRTWPVVKLDNGKSLTARLLVGADGANSPVRTFAEIESRGWDYGKMGMVATLKLEEGAGQRVKEAYQRFLPTGPIAMLPLPGDYATMVWSTSPSIAAQLKRLTLENLTALINAAFRVSPVDLSYLHTIDEGIVEEVSWRLSVIRPDESRLPPKVVGIQEGTVAGFPLKMRHADSYIAERVALLGDAAHTTHPLAGQGLNLGVGDAESLIKTLERAVQNGQDIGSVLSLEPYFEERYFENHVMLGVVDKLHMLYGTTAWPVVGLRSLGLEAVNKMGWVKDILMKRASGERLW